MPCRQTTQNVLPILLVCSSCCDIGLRRHLLQFLASSWQTELYIMACHHYHVFINWNGCKSGGRLGWWTRNSWYESCTLAHLSKISGSPPTILNIFWNGFDSVCTKRRWNVQEDRQHPWHWVDNMGFHVAVQLPLWGEQVGQGSLIGQLSVQCLHFRNISQALSTPSLTELGSKPRRLDFWEEIVNKPSRA